MSTTSAPKRNSRVPAIASAAAAVAASPNPDAVPAAEVVPDDKEKTKEFLAVSFYNHNFAQSHHKNAADKFRVALLGTMDREKVTSFTVTPTEGPAKGVPLNVNIGTPTVNSVDTESAIKELFPSVHAELKKLSELDQKKFFAAFTPSQAGITAQFGSAVLPQMLRTGQGNRNVNVKK